MPSVNYIWITSIHCNFSLFMLTLQKAAKEGLLLWKVLLTYIILTHTLPSSGYQEFGIYTLHIFSISFKYIRFQADSVLWVSSEAKKAIHFNKSTQAWDLLPASSSSLPATLAKVINSNSWILNNFSFTWALNTGNVVI